MPEDGHQHAKYQYLWQYAKRENESRAVLGDGIRGIAAAEKSEHKGRARHGRGRNCADDMVEGKQCVTHRRHIQQRRRDGELQQQRNAAQPPGHLAAVQTEGPGNAEEHHHAEHGLEHATHKVSR